MIGILPIRGNALPQKLVEDLKESLEAYFGEFGLNVKLMPGIDIKPFLNSYNEIRGQFLASMIAYGISGIGECILGVVDVDLYERGMNFVFGVAIPPLKSAVISTYRLDPRFYGEPFDYEKLRERTLKEAVHELGHIFGLLHCPNPKCVMHFSNSILDTDFKGWRFCERCEEKVKYNISRLKEGKGDD